MPPPTATEPMALGLNPARIFDGFKYTPDQCQRDFLRSNHLRILMNCSRQSGKSTTVAGKAIHKGLFAPGSLVLLLSRVRRQASELFRKEPDFYNALGRPIPPRAESALRIESANNSRIVALPGRALRGFVGWHALSLRRAGEACGDLPRPSRTQGVPPADRRGVRL
jgi:hypothetical protein